MLEVLNKLSIDKAEISSVIFFFFLPLYKKKFYQKANFIDSGKKNVFINSFHFQKRKFFLVNVQLFHKLFPTFPTFLLEK